MKSTNGLRLIPFSTCARFCCPYTSPSTPPYATPPQPNPSPPHPVRCCQARYALCDPSRLNDTIPFPPFLRTLLLRLPIKWTFRLQTLLPAPNLAGAWPGSLSSSALASWERLHGCFTFTALRLYPLHESFVQG